jgi:hypothetical protein
MFTKSWFRKPSQRGNCRKSNRRSRSFLVEMLECRAVPAVFTVTNGNDSGAGSLRQAILDANTAPGQDTIAFNIPGPGLHAIIPTSILPVVSDAVTIDGYTQPGSSPNTNGIDQPSNAVFGIELNSSQALGYGFRGLRLTGGNTVVRGLSVQSFPSNEIEFMTNGNNVAEGNKVSGNIVVFSGTGNRLGGTVPAARNVAAISVSSDNNVIVGNFGPIGVSGSHNQIGGRTPVERNVINSGRPGLYISGSFNIVEGNYIGTDPTGMVKVLNRRAGVFLDYTATGNLIGGTAPGAGNVISGNERGIYIWGGYNNTVQGNFIGPNAAGTGILFQPEGIVITEYAGPANFNLIGGTDPRARNVISGNGVGIDIIATRNTVQGNWIGVLPDGVTPAGNLNEGIDLPGINSYDNLIGGTEPGAGNIIAYSTGVAGYPSASGAGVRVDGIQGYNPGRNAILGNSIFGNAGLAIDLTNDPDTPGVTFNDPGDGDTGANNLQNFPVLNSAVIVGSSTEVSGSLNSTPNSTFTIECFANAAADPSGYGEGQRFIGRGVVTIDGSGNAAFDFVLAGATTPGEVITATATDSAGNTSEFSFGVVATGAAAPQIQNTQVNDGSAQRSRVTSLSVTFSTQVTFSSTVASAFTLTRNGGGSVAFAATASVVNGVTVVTLNSFTGPEAEFGSLRDGRYTLTALAAQITAGGVHMASDYTFGESQGLFRFYGDYNGDRHVDIADLGLFSTTYGLRTGQTGFMLCFDFNNDGTIDILDFGQFAIRMSTVLP